jgi:DedD protein
MVDKPEATEPEESAADLRNKLIKRLAVAGVLVAILLGVLAFFDYLSTAPEESDGPEFTQPVPVAPKKTLSQPVTPASELPEPPTPAPVVAETPPPPPQPVAQPALPSVSAPETKPEAAAPHHETRQPGAVPAPAVVKPVVPASVPTPVEPRVLRPVPESTAAPSVVIAPESVVVPAAKPAARVLESRPAPVVVPSGASRLFSGFLLQAGVFTSQQRAEELHAKLTLSGVPSTLETRVQVGPFTTRQEAEAAQAKLKELGVETVLVPPRSAKH